MCVYVCMYVCVYVYVCMCVCVCVFKKVLGTCMVIVLRLANIVSHGTGHKKTKKRLGQQEATEASQGLVSVVSSKSQGATWSTSRSASASGLLLWW